MRFRELCNRTFVRSMLSFLIVLLVSFIVLIAGEYVRAKQLSEQNPDSYQESYSGCITNTGQAC